MQLVRFALVGVTVAALYVGLYLAFLRLGLPQVAANALAFLIAVAVQYIGQAAFTFERRLNDRPQMIRFAAMIALGLAMSALITGHGLGLPDWAAAVFVTLWLPIQNYLFMTLWVFVSPQPTTDTPT